MNTGISRFMLLSAALHLGVLAAAGYTLTRPQLLPSVLTVTLEEASALTGTPARTREPSAFSDATASGKEAKHSAHPKPVKDSIRKLPQQPSPSLMESTQQDSQLNDKAIPADPRGKYEITESIPSLPGSEGPGEEKGMHDITQHTATPQAQQLDASALTTRLVGRLRNALGPYFTYPLLARRNGWEGQVQVGLRVEADGRLSHVHIAHSSGYSTLDSAALTTLNRIDTLPDAAGWLDGRHFDMVLPIEYRLIDGQS
jgi:TonB family protein